MEQKPQKNKKKKFNAGRLKVLILLGVLIYAGITLANLQSKISDQAERGAELQAEQETLERELEYRDNELNYIGSDEYVEKQARERLGWLKEGETKYVEAEDGSVTPEQTADPAAQSTAGASSLPPDQPEEPDTEPTPESSEPVEMG